MTEASIFGEAVTASIIPTNASKRYVFDKESSRLLQHDARLSDAEANIALTLESSHRVQTRFKEASDFDVLSLLFIRSIAITSF